MIPASSIVKPSADEAVVGTICDVKVSWSVYSGKVAALGKLFYLGLIVCS